MCKEKEWAGGGAGERGRVSAIFICENGKKKKNKTKKKTRWRTRRSVVFLLSWNCVLAARLRTLLHRKFRVWLTCVSVPPGATIFFFFGNWKLWTLGVNTSGSDWPRLVPVFLNGFIHLKQTEAGKTFTTSVAIKKKFKSESYMVSSLSFFIVILVKKNNPTKKNPTNIQLQRRSHYWNHAVSEPCQYVYEVWIHFKTLRLCCTPHF